MSIAEKLKTVAENEEKVYTAGETAGLGVAESVLSDGFTNYSYFCYDRNTLTTAPANLLLHTKNGTDFSRMFQSCSALKEVPLFDTSSGTKFDYMFQGCSALEEVPLFDMSKGTTAKNMFSSCSALKEIPSFNARKISDLANAFDSCKALSKVPSFDFSYCSNFSHTFFNCTELTEVGVLDTSSGTNFSYMFGRCSKLHTVAGIDFSSEITNTVFEDCPALANLVVNGKIKKTTTAFKYTSALTHDSLMSIINALVDYSAGASTYTITFGSTNLAKLTEEEKLMITNKGWTYA